MLKNPIADFIGKIQSSQEVQKAKSRFRAKPFHEQFKPLKHLANVGRHALPLVSVATGLMFLASILLNIIPQWLAFSLAGLLLVLWESAKAFLLASTFENYYGGAKGWAGLLVVALLFSVGSAFFSVRGAAVLHENLDNSVNLYQDVYELKIDSLERHYSNQIEAVKQELAAFKSSVSWKGKINLYNKTVAQTIQGYNKQIERLQNERETALKGLADTHQTELARVTSKAEFNGAAFIWLAAIVDALIILANWFLIFFDYRTARESEIFTGGGAQTVNLNDNPFNQFLEFMQVHTGAGLSLPSANSEGKKQIGFSRNDKGIDTGSNDIPENSEKPYINTGIDTGIDTPSEELRQMRDFLEKYQHVVRDIDKGVSIRQCVSKHGVSKTTVQNVKRVMKALDAYE